MGNESPIKTRKQILMLRLTVRIHQIFSSGITEGMRTIPSQLVTGKQLGDFCTVDVAAIHNPMSLRHKKSAGLWLSLSNFMYAVRVMPLVLHHKGTPRHRFQMNMRCSIVLVSQLHDFISYPSAFSHCQTIEGSRDAAGRLLL